MTGETCLIANVCHMTIILITLVLITSGTPRVCRVTLSFVHISGMRDTIVIFIASKFSDVFNILEFDELLYHRYRTYVNHHVYIALSVAPCGIL